MKKAMIASVTVFALAVSAGMSIAGPSRDLGQLGYAQDVRSSASQTRYDANVKAGIGTQVQRLGANCYSLSPSASCLNRDRTATQSNEPKAFTSGRALTELTTTEGLLFWAQAEGTRDSYTVGGNDVTTNSGGMRYGADLPLGEVAGGQVFGGLEFGISNQSSDVGIGSASANISTNAYDATLSALWVANSQLYFEGRLCYGYFDSSVSLNGGDAMDFNGSGYGISIEVGKPFTLSDKLTLIPQVQVMYSDIDMGDFAGQAGGGQIGSLVDGETLMARVGLRAERVVGDNAMFYGQVDFYRTFDSETSVAFGQNTVLTGRGQNTAALSLGSNIALSDRSWLYGEITTETGLGSNSGDYAFSWDIGLEFQF